MIKIQIYNCNGELLGSDKMDNSVYDFNFKMLKAFDFIPATKLRKDYIIGKFLLQDCENDLHSDERPTVFTVKKYKLLCKNTDTLKQFDDEANSIWKEFENNSK